MNTTTPPHAGTADGQPKKSFTRFFPAIARFLLGLPLLVFGLNGLLHFFPEPQVVLPENAMTFVNALMKSGYMLPLIAITQAIVGLFLVINRFVPLALALLAPFLVNSLAFHIFLERSGLPMSCIFAAFEIYLAWCYRNAYRPMLAARVSPA